MMLPYNFLHDITPCWGKLTSHHPCFKASGAWFKGARRRSKVQMLMDRLGLRWGKPGMSRPVSTIGPWEILHLVLVGGAITILKNMSSSMGRIIPYTKWKITNIWNHQPEHHWTLWVMGFQWFLMWWYLMVHLAFVMGITSHLVWWCYV